MTRLLLLCVLASLAACRAADRTCSTPGMELRASLTPTTFDGEQTMMAGIHSGISFERTDSGQRRGTIEVRGETFAVLRDDSGPEPRVAIDGDRSAAFEREEFRTGERTTHVVHFGSEQVVVAMVSQEAASEYSVRELWKARFDHGGEVLELGALQFGVNSIQFADDDLDGVYEAFVAPDNPIWLAGRAWDVEVNFESRSARLVAVDRNPVAAGFEAPRLDARALESGDPVPLVVDGHTTVLLFCHSGCPGCRLIADPVADLRGAYAGDDSVRFLSIGRTPDHAAGNRDLVCPTYDHVVSDEAWSAYAVRPTPTLVVIDGAGMITYRGLGAGPRSGSMLRREIEAARN